MNKIERTLLIGNSLWALSAGLLGPLFAVFAERVGGDVLDISWIWALFLIVSGLGIILVGKISDRFSLYTKMLLMLLGFALNALFSFGYLLVHAPIHLFIVQIGLAFSSIFANPTWYALYDKYSGDGAEDGSFWGYATGTQSMLAGFSLAVGGYIVSLFSFEVLFITMGSIQTIATIYQAKILRLYKSKKGDEK